MPRSGAPPAGSRTRTTTDARDRRAGETRAFAGVPRAPSPPAPPARPRTAARGGALALPRARRPRCAEPVRQSLAPESRRSRPAPGRAPLLAGRLQRNQRLEPSGARRATREEPPLNQHAAPDLEGHAVPASIAGHAVPSSQSGIEQRDLRASAGRCGVGFLEGLPRRKEEVTRALIAAGCHARGGRAHSADALHQDAVDANDMAQVTCRMCSQVLHSHVARRG